MAGPGSDYRGRWKGRDLGYNLEAKLIGFMRVDEDNWEMRGTRMASGF